MISALFLKHNLSLCLVFANSTRLATQHKPQRPLVPCPLHACFTTLDLYMGPGDLLGSPYLYSKCFTNWILSPKPGDGHPRHCTAKPDRSWLLGTKEFALPISSYWVFIWLLFTYPTTTPMQHRVHALRSHLHLHVHTHNWFLISLCWRGIKSCAGKNCSRREPCSGWQERKGSLKKTLSLRFRQTGLVRKQPRLPVGSEFPSWVCPQKGGWSQSSAQLGDFIGAEIQTWKEPSSSPPPDVRLVEDTWPWNRMSILTPASARITKFSSLSLFTRCEMKLRIPMLQGASGSGLSRKTDSYLRILLPLPAYRAIASARYDQLILFWKTITFLKLGFFTCTNVIKNRLFSMVIFHTEINNHLINWQKCI